MEIKGGTTFALAAAAALLLWPAAWNLYPIVFADTGTYLSQAIHFYAGWDRPVFYSLLIRPLHLKTTLWPIVLAQAVLTAWLLRWVCRVLVPALSAGRFLLLLLGLAALTWLPWLVSEVMPDLFTPLVVLILPMLAFAPLSGAQRWLLTGLASVMVATQQSSLPLSFALGAACILLRPLLAPVPVASLSCRHGRPCAAHPRLCSSEQVTDGRQEPDRDEANRPKGRAGSVVAEAPGVDVPMPSPIVTAVPVRLFDWIRDRHGWRACTRHEGDNHSARRSRAAKLYPASSGFRVSSCVCAPPPANPARGMPRFLRNLGMQTTLPQRCPPLLPLLPCAAAALALCCMNLAAHSRFAVSPFGDIFLLARVVADGPGLDALRTECPVRPWRLCAYLAELPADSDAFLWTPESPLHRAGGPKLIAAEAPEIIRAALSLEPWRQAQAALANTVQQMARFASGDGLNPWPAQVTPWLVQDFPAQEAGRYAAARQQSGTLALPWPLGAVHRLVAVAGVAACLILLAGALRRRDLAGGFLMVVLLSLPLSAAITGALSGPHDRYQARIMWLPPFVASLAFMRRHP